MLKFRTMKDDAKRSKGPRITAHDDQRITPLGHWLRQTKINELPQLWNVLIGDMSFVGPRPEDPKFVERWPEDIKAEILSIKPGITSPASVIYRDEEKMLKSDSVISEYLKKIVPDKQRLDQLYVHNRNLLTDLDVLLWTSIKLLSSITQTPIPEKLLFFGPLSRFIRRYVSWFVVDLITAFLAIGIAGIIQRASAPLDLGIGNSILLAIVIAVFFSIINTFLGLGQITWRQANPYYFFDVLLSVSITTVIVYFVNTYWPNGHLVPPGMVIETGVFALIGFILVRYRERLITGFASRWLHFRQKVGTLGERVLVVGAGECGRLFCGMIQRSRYFSIFNIEGIIDDNPNIQGLKLDGLPILGMTSDIPTVVDKKNIGIVFFAIHNIKPKEKERIRDLCNKTAARIVVVPDLVQILENAFSQSGFVEKNEDTLVK